MESGSPCNGKDTVMETAPLKSFATWARTALIREVNARIVAVLAPASKERVEIASAVTALERDIAAKGGGETGRDAVADKAAYTWFNRIIALRFMDANGYTGIGIVSPPRGQTSGQPEALADAKRGNIDTAVVTNKGTAEAITALLDGTRRSDDAQGEAYALLLAEYCRHWNRSMPFMFEREGDYTELLIPANMLADDSVIARAATVLSEDVCGDVEVIGWLYQFYISERKDEVFAGFKKNKKAGAAEIPAATQLFTPHWIVRYIVENSLGRLWLLNRPSSRLADQMEYYIAPVDDEADFLKVSSPEELKIIDPAVGSGHMLTYAFDLLFAIYEEDGYAPADIPGLILRRNLFGTEIDPRAGALAAFALAMKARAKQRTFFAKQIQPNICVLESVSFTSDELLLLCTEDGDRAEEESFWRAFEHADSRGSLIKAPEIDLARVISHLEKNIGNDQSIFSNDLNSRALRVINEARYLACVYHVVVANPPYMGSKNMDGPLSGWLKQEYPNGASDLYSAFIQRAIDMAKDRGIVAMITMQSWMFLSTSRQFRRDVASSTVAKIFAHLGTNAFDTVGGEIVSTVAFVLQRTHAPAALGLYIRLTELETPEAKMRSLGAVSRLGAVENCYIRSGRSFARLPGERLMYWLSEETSNVLSQSGVLGDFAPAIQGMITGSNVTFLRLWHEVSFARLELRGDLGWTEGMRWAPYNKGGESRRWYGAQLHVVDWSKEGSDFVRSRATNSQFYFREYLSWTYRSSDDFAPRLYPPGFLWDVAGSGVFPASRETMWAILALLGSSSGSYLMNCLNPTSTFQVENVLEMPMDAHLEGDIRTAAIDEKVVRAAEITRSDWERYEIAWDFLESPIVARGKAPLRSLISDLCEDYKATCEELADIESDIDAFFADLYHLRGTLAEGGGSSRSVTLNANYFDSTSGDILKPFDKLVADSIRDLVSYIVGCMFGRYSLDEPGLILANQGDTLHEYLAKVASPSFLPDRDNVIPIVDGDWFEDDIVERFRQFLRIAFVEEHFEENLRFVTESLGVKDLRDYFVKSFYKDHVQRYKKRPIYWLFSSPKGSFSALIYMHRYTPSTVSTVLNEYLREFKAKLEASRQHHERLAFGVGTPRDKAAAEKEVDRLRKVLLELDEYEHDVLYPLATQQIAIDLDDGVKANYPKFGSALKKIPGLEAGNE